MSEIEFRFQVALSFPGEHRPRVEGIARILAKRLGPDKVLYDRWYAAELARPNLDVYLPKLYHEQSRLLVFFLCGEYEKKDWCGLEWRAGRDLLKQRHDDQLMFLRLDHADIGGLYSIDGYLDISGMSDAETAEAILKRLTTSTTFARFRQRLAEHVMDGAFLETIVRDLRTWTFTDIKDRCGTMRILSMEEPIELAEIYTDVMFLKKRTANLRKTKDQLISEANWDTLDRVGIPARKAKRVPSLLAFQGHRRLVIYGKPGAGKTTLLKRLAIECAEGRFRPELVPVFIPLRDFAETEESPTLFRYIEEQWGAHENARTVLNQGRAMVLLDGLDEVRDRDFKRVRKAVEDFATEFRNCTMALTCRIAAREYTFERFSEVEIADFNAAQIKTFATQWFRAQREERKKGSKTRTFLQNLRANRSLLELASSPLLLALLCLVFQERNGFEGTRAALYREGLDILFGKWDAQRGVERDRPYALTIRDMEILLEEIAYNRFLASEYFFDLDSLEREIIALFKYRNLLEPGTEPRPVTVLNSFESHMGLLVHRSTDVYSFSHLTFQEYLTARHMAANAKLVTENGPNVGDRRWHEVWLLLSMILDAEGILPELKSQVDLLVEGDSEIQKYLGWCNCKATSQQEYRPSAVRAFYFALEIVHASAVERFVQRHLTCDLALARALDLDLASVIKSARAEAVKSARDGLPYSRIEIAPSLRGELRLDFALDRVLDETRGITFLRSKLNVDDVDRDLALAVRSAQAISQALVRELWDSRVAYGKHLSKDWWDRLRATAIRHRNLGHDWNFSESQLDLIGRYYRANLLLLECIRVSRGLTDKTRRYIEDTLLLPVHEISSLAS
jgi:hypothetical protein